MINVSVPKYFRKSLKKMGGEDVYIEMKPISPGKAEDFGQVNPKSAATENIRDL